MDENDDIQIDILKNKDESKPLIIETSHDGRDLKKKKKYVRTI